MPHSPPLRIYAAPAVALPPFPVEAFVLEQDRDLLLDPEPVLREPEESLERLIESAEKTDAKSAGSVVVTGKSVPYCFLAIVHDLSIEPSWQEEWIASALQAAFGEAENRRFESIAMPLLGTVYGKMPYDRSIELLRDSLAAVDRTSLRNIWLLTPNACDEDLLRPLANAGYVLIRPERIPSRPGSL
jgi:hypothetical protein